MKTNSLLLLASLAALTSSLSAAPTRLDSEVVVLPTYVVATPRYQPAEQQVNVSLAELRNQANTPAIIATEVPALKAQVVRPDAVAQLAKDTKVVRFAKS